jgi:hypothetical protein
MSQALIDIWDIKRANWGSDVASENTSVAVPVHHVIVSISKHRNAHFPQDRYRYTRPLTGKSGNDNRSSRITGFHHATLRSSRAYLCRQGNSAKRESTRPLASGLGHRYLCPRLPRRLMKNIVG